MSEEELDGWIGVLKDLEALAKERQYFAESLVNESVVIQATYQGRSNATTTAYNAVLRAVRKLREQAA